MLTLHIQKQRIYIDFTLPKSLLQFLTPDVQLRGSDEKMVEFKALAVQYRHVIKNYLNVSISEKLTPIAIAQKLLAKIDLKLDYNRPPVQPQ